MHKFTAFLESLRTENNSSLIETIHSGFSACFEAESEADLTREEWLDMKRWSREQKKKLPKHLSLKYPYKAPESEPYIPRKTKRQPRYSNSPDAEGIKRNLIREFGGYHTINKKGKLGWKNFQIELNKRLRIAGV